MRSEADIVAAGGCRFKGDVFENGEEWHPRIQPWGEMRCINCSCKVSFDLRSAFWPPTPSSGYSRNCFQLKTKTGCSSFGTGRQSQVQAEEVHEDTLQRIQIHVVAIGPSSDRRRRRLLPGLHGRRTQYDVHLTADQFDVQRHQTDRKRQEEEATGRSQPRAHPAPEPPRLDRPQHWQHPSITQVANCFGSNRFFFCFENVGTPTTHPPAECCLSVMRNLTLTRPEIHAESTPLNSLPTFDVRLNSLDR